MRQKEVIFRMMRIVEVAVKSYLRLKCYLFDLFVAALTYIPGSIF